MPSISRPQIVVYPTKEEYQEILKKSQQLGLSLSKYLIFCGVHAEIKIEIINPQPSK